MALDYNYGNPYESFETAHQSLKDLYAKVNDEKAKKLEQNRGREDANSMAMRLLRTARLASPGNQGASGMSQALAKGTETGAGVARDIRINQNENDLANRFKLIASAAELGQAEQGATLEEEKYLQMLKQYQDTLANRQEDRAWSLEDFKNQLDAAKQLKAYEAELTEGSGLSRFFGGLTSGISGGLSSLLKNYSGK